MKDVLIYIGTIFHGKSKDIHSHVPTKNTGKKYNIIWSLENNIKVQSLHIAKLSPSENMILSTSYNDIIY